MDAKELLKAWPGWSNAGAEMVLASPAWRLPVRVGDRTGVLRFGPEAVADTIDLAVTLDDEPHVLSLVDSPCFPDLHLLWAQRAGLPPEVLLALLEKECGAVFSLVETATRRMLGVKGLAEAPSPAARRLDATVGDVTVSFALDVPSEVLTEWGRLENLEPAHPAIRALTRPVQAYYLAFDLSDGEIAALAPGDHLLVPDDAAAARQWLEEAPADDRVHACAPDAVEISFGAFADETLPPVPEPDRLVLVHKGSRLAACVPATLGTARTLKLVSTP